MQSGIWNSSKVSTEYIIFHGWNVFIYQIYAQRFNYWYSTVSIVNITNIVTKLSISLSTNQ